MKRIIDILRDNKIECFPNQRFTLDVEMFPEDEKERYFPSNTLFENPCLKGDKKVVQDLPNSSFRFFLDGSQRSHRLLDASLGGRYLPICGGQIGVSVLERTEKGTLAPRRDLTKIENILTVPKGRITKDNAEDLQEKINNQINKRYAFRISRYDESKEDKDPGDLARAKIIQEMQTLELKTIREMISQNLIQQDRILVKDGGLQYSDEKIKALNLDKDDLV